MIMLLYKQVLQRPLSNFGKGGSVKFKFANSGISLEFYEMIFVEVLARYHVGILRGFKQKFKGCFRLKDAWLQPQTP